VCVATWISLTSIVLCSLLGLDQLTNAFGLLTMTRGIATLIGSPLAGQQLTLSLRTNVATIRPSASPNDDNEVATRWSPSCTQQGRDLPNVLLFINFYHKIILSLS